MAASVSAQNTTAVDHPGSKDAKALVCPAVPVGCVVKHREVLGADQQPIRCEELKCKAGVYSRDWTGVVQKMFAEPSASKMLAIARSEGLIVKADTAGDQYGHLYYSVLDPVTGNQLMSSSVILDTFPGTHSAARDVPARAPSLPTSH